MNMNTWQIVADVVFFSGGHETSLMVVCSCSVFMRVLKGLVEKKREYWQYWSQKTEVPSNQSHHVTKVHWLGCICKVSRHWTGHYHCTKRASQAFSSGLADTMCINLKMVCMELANSRHATRWR